MFGSLLAAVVVRAVAQDTSPPVACLLSTVPAPREEELDHDEPPAPLPAARSTALLADPLLQSGPFRAAASPLVSFEGLGAGMHSASGHPPDANSAVGPNHVLEATNGWLAIFDKEGRALWGPSATLDLWQGFPGTCSISDSGDPTALYDWLADRWVITQMAWDQRDGFTHQCVAVSATADPLGAWHRYQFPYAAPNDFGKIGLWPDAYLFSTSVVGTTYQPYVCAFDRVRMLEGADATAQCFPVSADEAQPMPADLRGSLPPPAGTPGYFLSSPIPGSFGVFRLHVDWAHPTASSLSPRQAVPVADWSPAVDPQGIKQPGTSQGLIASTGLLPEAVGYRNFGDHESLVATHTVDAGNGLIGARWYELRTDAAGGLRIFQQGTLAPDSSHRFVGSIAMDKAGGIAVAYSVSSSSVFPSLRYSGRLASDAPGELTIGEGSLYEGSFAQMSSPRWGDYSSLKIDPADDCTFWFTGQYAAVDRAGSRISAFRLPGCGVKADFSVSVSPDSQDVLAGTSARFDVRINVVSGAPQQVALAVAGLPPGFAASFFPAVIAPGSASALTVAVPPGAAPMAIDFTVRAANSTASHDAPVLLAVRQSAIDGGDPDGGSSDAGTADAGSGGVTDAGSVVDAGSGGVQDGSTNGGGESRTSGGCSSVPGPLGPLFLALLVLRRRSIGRRS